MRGTVGGEATPTAATAGAGRSTIVSVGAFVRIHASSFAVNPDAGATIRSKRSTSQSFRSACVSDRPFSIRASTGTPARSAACSTASSSGSATATCSLRAESSGYCSGTTSR